MRFSLVIWALVALLGVGCEGGTAGTNSSDLPSGSDLQRKASAHAGMGAVVFSGGTAFRVWAPNATKAWVAGEFNNWSGTANPLVSEGDGNFSVDVASARAGQAYKFVIQHGTQVLWKADPRALKMTEADGNSVIVDPASYRWSGASFTTPKFKQQVIYELHVGSFNDATNPGTGTWATATEKLDYLAALGVNMLEVLPPAEFPGSYSWGYNPSYPFAPETAYGSPEQMKAFIDGAHARGMGVIIDVVHNHYGPNDLSMWCFDGECLGAGGVYFYTDWRGQTDFGPRPDFGRSQVRSFVVDNALMWLRDYHADGLRWDSVVNIREAVNNTVTPAVTRNLAEGWQVLQQANDQVDATQPWKIMIAEDLQNDDQITSPTSEGGAGFDSQWDNGFFFSPIKEVLTAATDGDRDMNRVNQAISHVVNGSATQRVIFTEDHDKVASNQGGTRIPVAIDPTTPDSLAAKKRSTLGAALALTSPGIPMLMMGQEFLESLAFPFGQTQAMDWSKSTRNAGITRMYTDLIHLRRNTAGHTQGLQGNGINVFHLNNSAKVVAFHRFDQGGAGDDVVVIANFSSRAFTSYEIGLPSGGTWKVRFNGDSTRYDSSFAGTPSNDLTTTPGQRDGLPFHGNVGIGPYSVVVLSQG